MIRPKVDFSCGCSCRIVCRQWDLLPHACEQGVNFAPGPSFFPEPSLGVDWLRLNFAAQPPEGISEGLQRLGKVIKSGARLRKP